MRDSESPRPEERGFSPCPGKIEYNKKLLKKRKTYNEIKSK